MVPISNLCVSRRRNVSTVPGQPAGDVRNGEADAAQVALGRHARNRERITRCTICGAASGQLGDAAPVARALPIEQDRHCSGQASGEPARTVVLVRGDDGGATFEGGVKGLLQQGFVIGFAVPRLRFIQRMSCAAHHRMAWISVCTSVDSLRSKSLTANSSASGAD
jgi:hypothetical protein